MDDFDDFDPMAPEYDGEGEEFPDDIELKEPGIYLLAFVYFHEMRTSQKGNPFARFKLKVLYGDGARTGESKAGQMLWESVFVNARSFKRLSALCRACGFTERFNPRDAKMLQHALLGRPFLAKVKMEQNGKYNDARIKWPVFREWEEPERDAAASFLATWGAESAIGGGGGAGFDESAPHPADSFGVDDIPF